MVMQETEVCANLTGGEFLLSYKSEHHFKSGYMQKNLIVTLHFDSKDIMYILRLTYTPFPAYYLLIVMNIEFN